MPSYEIDWDEVDKDSEAIERGNQIAKDSIPKDGTASNYLKMVEPGVQKLRLLPMGNFVMKKPYKKIYRHELKVYSQQGEGFAFVLCWEYIAKEKEEIAKPLAKAQRLFKEDSDKYRQYGCPICGARQALYDADRAAGGKTMYKDAANGLGAREKWLWNCIARTSGEGRTAGEVYVYSCSKTIGEAIYGQIKDYRENNINVLDLRAGYDYHVTATGPNNGSRRYNSPMFLAIPVPALKTDPRGESIIPHDLTEFAMQNFKNYQDTIDTLLQAMGKTLAKIGYTVPGDESSWDGGAELTPHSVTREVFPDEVPRNRKIKREDYNSAEEYFDSAVPPSDPEEEEVRMRTTKTKPKVLASRPDPRKNVTGTNSPNVWEDDEDDVTRKPAVKTSKTIQVGDRNVRLQKKGKVTRILEELEEDDIPF